MSYLGRLRRRVAAKLAGGRAAPDRGQDRGPRQAPAPRALSLSSRGHFATAKGAQFLQQICKHFGHEHPVSFDAAAGRVELYSGLAHFTADDSGLTARVEAADVRGLLEVRYVVDKHLAIFAHRERFTGFAWSDPYA